MELLIKLTKTSTLSAEQLFILYLLYSDKAYYEEYVKAKRFRMTLGSIIQDLAINSYIKVKENGNIYNAEHIEVNLSACKMFDDNNVVYPYLMPTHNFNEQWEELLALYPKKSGERPLHNMKDRCRGKYAFVLKKESHENVIKGLKKEIELRQLAKATNKFFPEWKLLSSYINQKGWEQFLSDENETETHGLGGRITKIL